MNRESWLTQATLELERVVFAPIDKHLPDAWRVSCSWPSRRAAGPHQSGASGQCFDSSLSADATTELLVSMSQDNPVKVLAILAHEMIHAIEGCAAGHGAVFKRTALAIGLTGKMTATVAGDAFKQSIEPILETLGDYPHAAVDIRKRKRQSTRMIKMTCADCGYIARTSATNISSKGTTLCPCNHEPMTCDM